MARDPRLTPRVLAVLATATAIAALAPAALGASAGGGAELPARAFERWCATAADCTYEIHDRDLDAAALGRGAVDWLGLSEPLTAAEERAVGGPLAHVPVLLDAIAVSVNIPGTSGHHVRLSGRVLGQIFSGGIVNWGDARIQRQNRHRSLGRGGPITLCVPAYASGTTWDMTEYLAGVSPEYRATMGGATRKPASWRSPRVVRVADVEALGDCVRAHTGAIAFWSYADAIRHGETEDVIAVGEPRTIARTRTGRRTAPHTELVYRHPNERTMRAATVEAEREMTAAGDGYVFDLHTSAADGAYPITTVAWVGYRADRGLTRGARASLLAMLSEARQGELEGLGYGRLSPAVLAHARRTIAAAPRAGAPPADAEPAPTARAAATASTIAADVAQTGLLTLSDVTITSTANPVQASATLTTVHNSTPMAVAVSYTGADNWTITIARGSAGTSYAPPYGTSLNVNQVSGTITETAGALAFNLTLSGQVLGDGTFDMAVIVSADTGLEANAIVNDVTIGGMELESAAVAVSTAADAASVSGTLVTTGGTFDAALSVQGSKSSYTISLAVSGADLEPSSSSFEVLSFAFGVTVVTNASDACSDVTASFAGSVKIGNGTYTMSNGTIAFCGRTLEKFLFDVSYSHYVKWKKSTDTATLRVGWAGVPGTYTSPRGDVWSYASGYFGNVRLTQTREFSKKYEGTTFKRGVTIGVGFGMAAMTAADGTQTIWFGAGGAVEADRVSGALVCDFYAAPSADFICGVTMRINPSWAGVYEYGWWTI